MPISIKFINSSIAYEYGDTYVDATGHSDNDGDGYCDAYNETFEVDNPSDDCDYYKSGIERIIHIIVLFFQRLFGLNKICDCGIAHY